MVWRNGAARTGGEKRSGGAAKGIPRNLLTAAVAVGKTVVVPTMHPASTWTVGFCAETTVLRIRQAAMVSNLMMNVESSKREEG